MPSSRRPLPISHNRACFERSIHIFSDVLVEGSKRDEHPTQVASHPPLTERISGLLCRYMLDFGHRMLMIATKSQTRWKHWETFFVGMSYMNEIDRFRTDDDDEKEKKREARELDD